MRVVMSLTGAAHLVGLLPVKPCGRREASGLGSRYRCSSGLFSCGFGRGSAGSACACRVGGQRLDGKACLAPGLEPAEQRVDVMEADGGGAQGYTGAGRLPGLRAVEDDLAVSWDRVAGMSQLAGVDHAGSRDLVRRRLDVEGGPQVDDHEMVAGVWPLLEPGSGDASLAQVRKGPTAPHVLER